MMNSLMQFTETCLIEFTSVEALSSYLKAALYKSLILAEFTL